MNLNHHVNVRYNRMKQNKYRQELEKARKQYVNDRMIAKQRKKRQQNITNQYTGSYEAQYLKDESGLIKDGYLVNQMNNLNIKNYR